MATALQDQLDAALIAWGKLISGTAARVYVDQNGERIEYNAASKAGLQAWIAALQAAIRCGNTEVLFGRTRPLRPVF